MILQNILDETFTSLISGADAVEAQCKRFEVRASEGGKVLFSADEDEIVIGADRLKVTGTVIIRFLNGCKLIFFNNLSNKQSISILQNIHLLEGKKSCHHW